MKDFKLPHVGSRNIKTALAVFICLLFLNKSLMAAIAAIICMQSTIEDSVVTGINRLIGTLLGGLLGIVIIYFISLFNLQDYSVFIAALSVSLVICICNLIKKPAACVISSIVVLGIVIDPSIDNQFSYALNRTLETSLGVVIAILVNRFINPPTDSNLSLHEFNIKQENDLASHQVTENNEKDLNTLKTSNKVKSTLDLPNLTEENTKPLTLSAVNEKNNIESLTNSKNEQRDTEDIKSEKDDDDIK